MPRVYRHAVTGREVTVAEGSRMADLVAADDNYVEVDGRPRPAKKAAQKTVSARSKKQK